MQHQFPLTLSRLHAASGAERDPAWAAFVEEYSDILLRTCRSVVREHDAAMDAYAFALEALHAHDCRRLRAYAPDGRTKFTTWLAVVTRRLVIDYVRQRFGRPRSEGAAHREEHAVRRHLEHLVAAELDPELLESGGAAPDAAIRHADLVRGVRDAIARMEPHERLLLALKFTDERPVREIALTLGLPSVFHVYRRLATALARLRNELVRQGIEGTDP